MKYDPPKCLDTCDETHSEDCPSYEYDSIYFAWYFGASIKSAADSRRDLDLPSDASDRDVMIESLRYK